MAPAYQQLGHMVQVRTAMEPATAYRIQAGVIRGFVEALVLAGVSVEAEAGAVVAVAPGMVIDKRFKLAINSLGTNCGKDGYYAKR